jgi:FkbM family methyltransferase
MVRYHIKKILIYLFSLIPFSILTKFENLFSISQGRGFENAIEESKTLLKFASKNNINLLNIFDVGSFHGDYTNELLKKYPQSNYYLFEPDQKNFLFIKERFKEIKNINIFNIAITNKDEKGTLFSCIKGSLQGSLIQQDFSHLNVPNNVKQTIILRRIDTLMNELKLSSIDLCKIDIEGNEMNALIGASQLIKKIKIIQFEFGPASIDGRTFFKDFYKFFLYLLII